MSTATLVRPPAVDVGLVDPDNPWPGLASFREGDQAFFHGREAETESLYRSVLRERLTVLFGLAGLGKTSLLQAGLFSRLREDNLLPVYVRLNYAKGSPAPAAQVKQALADAAAAATVEGPAAVETETVWEHFHRQDAGYWSPRNRPVTPLLVFDQFEEAFTLGQADTARAAATNSFLTELADLVEGRPPAAVRERCDASREEARRYSFGHHPYKVLLSFREDFLPDLEGLRQSMPSVIHNRLRLEPMNGDQAFRVVKGTGGSLVARDVAHQVVRFVAGVGDAREVALEDLRVEPTLLSMLCYELNQSRRQRGEALITPGLLHGSRDRILSDFYERSMADVAPEVRAFVEERLITPRGHRESVALDDALDVPGVTEADLERLFKCYLLRREERCGVPRIELTHDVLTRVVRESRDARHQRLAAEATRLEAEGARRHAQAKARRFRLTAGAILLSVMAVAAGVVFEVWRAREDDRQRQSAAVLEVQEGSRLMSADRSPEALRHLSRAVSLDPESVPARATLLAHLIGRGWWLPRAVSSFPEGRVVAISPDGAFALTASATGTARVYEAGTGTPVGKPLSHGDWIYSAHWSPDGQRVVTASYDKRAVVWEVASGQELRALVGHQGAVYSARWSADGRWIVTASEDGTARVWDAQTGRAAGKPLVHASPVDSARFSPDGGRVVTASSSEARIWDLRTEASLGPPLRHDGPVLDAQWSPNGRLVVTSSADRTARVWDAQTGRSRGISLRHPRPVTSAQWSADGQRIATTSKDRTARVWDARTGKPVGEPLAQGAATYLAQFTSGGRVLTASWDWSLTEWDLPTVPAAATLLRHRGLSSATWTPDGQRVLTVSDDGTHEEWDAHTGRHFGSTSRHTSEVSTRQGGPAGYEVSTTHDEATRTWEVRVRDGRTGSAVGAVVRPDAKVEWAHLSPDGWRVLTASDDETATVWDLRTGEALGEPLQHEGPIRDGGFSPDGERIVTASEDGTARVWDARTGLAIDPPLRHEGEVRSARWSPDGQRLLTASADGAARLWDVPTASSSKHKRALQLAGALAGLDEKGRPLPTRQALEQLRELRGWLASHNEQPDGLASLIAWFLADPSVRTVSPLSKMRAEAHRQGAEDRAANHGSRRLGDEQ